MYLFPLSICILSFLILATTPIGAIDSTPSCINQLGEPVDWWWLHKLPNKQGYWIVDSKRVGNKRIADNGLVSIISRLIISYQRKPKPWPTIDISKPETWISTELQDAHLLAEEVHSYITAGLDLVSNNGESSKSSEVVVALLYRLMLEFIQHDAFPLLVPQSTVSNQQTGETQYASFIRRVFILLSSFVLPQPVVNHQIYDLFRVDTSLLLSQWTKSWTQLTLQQLDNEIDNNGVTSVKSQIVRSLQLINMPTPIVGQSPVSHLVTLLTSSASWENFIHQLYTYVYWLVVEDHKGNNGEESSDPYEESDPDLSQVAYSQIYSLLARVLSAASQALTGIDTDVTQDLLAIPYKQVARSLLHPNTPNEPKNLWVKYISMNVKEGGVLSAFAHVFVYDLPITSSQQDGFVQQLWDITHSTLWIDLSKDTRAFILFSWRPLMNPSFQRTPFRVAVAYNGDMITHGSRPSIFKGDPIERTVRQLEGSKLNYYGYDDIDVSQGHARGIFAWQLDGDGAGASGFWLTSSCPKSPSDDQLWWSDECHIKGQNAQCISVHSSNDEANTDGLYKRLVWQDNTFMLSAPSASVAAPLSAFDNIALHLLIRGAAESRKVSTTPLAIAGTYITYIMKNKVSVAGTSVAFPNLWKDTSGISSVLRSTDNDASGVVDHYVISKRHGIYADLYQEMVSPVVKQVVAQKQTSSDLSVIQPGGWTWFAYHGEGYTRNNDACCSGGFTKLCGTSIGCGIRCRPHAIYEAVTNVVHSQIINKYPDSRLTPSVVIQDTMKIVEILSTDVLDGSTINIRDYIRAKIDSGVYPLGLDIDNLIAVLRLSLTSGACGDSLVSGSIVSPPPSSIWAKQTQLRFTQYSIATSHDNSKGMFSNDGGWICHGDLDREGGRKQAGVNPFDNFWSGNNKRGGGAICANVPDIVDVWNALISDDSRYQCISSMPFEPTHDPPDISSVSSRQSAVSNQFTTMCSRKCAEKGNEDESCIDICYHT